MKKIVLILIIALAVTAAGFSQAANYTVQEVTGRVERNAGGDKWEPVKAGETLGADTVVRTVIGANLTVKHGDEILAVGPMKNGKLSEIASANSVIQVQPGRVSQTDTGSSGRTAGRLTTASARASTAIAVDPALAVV